MKFLNISVKYLFISCLVFLILIFLYLYKPETKENIRYQSYHFSDPIDWSYTIFCAKNCKQNEILYYLHGYSGNELTWLKAHKKIRKIWNKKKYTAPIVVGITLGKKWLLFHKNSKQKSGFLGIFLTRIIPEIEDKIKRPINKRSILGISMGGLNALQLALYKPDYFSKIALVSPPFMNLSPYDDQRKVDKYIQKVRSTSLSFKEFIKYYIFKKDTIKKNIHYMINSFKDYIPTQEIWLREYPLHSFSRKVYRNFPKIYLSCGKKDEYSFFEGTSLFFNIVKRKELFIKWSPLEGGHNVKNTEEIALFLMN